MHNTHFIFILHSIKPPALYNVINQKLVLADHGLW